MGFKEIFEEIFKPVIIVVNFFVNFFKKLPKLIKTLVKALIYFVSNFIPLIFDIIKGFAVFAQTLFHYLKNPYEFFNFIVQCLVFIPLITVSLFYNIPISKNLKIGEFFIYILTLISFTVFLLPLIISWWVTVKLFYEYIVLRSLDKATNGCISTFYYRYLLACENEPDSWYMNPNYHRNNLNKKYIIFSYKKCPKGFSPFGVFCNKNKYYQNDFCTEQNIYKAYFGHPYDSKGAVPLNQLRAEYVRKDSHAKQEAVDEYKDTIMDQQKECSTAFEKKQSLIKAICLDKFSNEKNLAVESFCKQNYCLNSSEPFCHFLKDNMSYETNAVNSNAQIVLYIFIVLTMLVLLNQAAKSA
tara:strand:- start:5187 stop:6254 length:1068 start_codon:yes stop_codon:yes gene_type:complete